MKTSYVSIILPTYNERDNVKRLVPQILNTLRRKHISCEIVIVDDESTDGSNVVFNTLASTYQNVRVYVRKNQRGLGTAIGFGIGKARGTVLVGMDADGNHPATLIPALLDRLSANTLVIASRFVGNGGMESRARYWLSFVANLVLRLFLGTWVHDCTSGFYAIRRSDLLSLGIGRIYYGYGDYHLRLVYFAQAGGYTLKEVSVKYQSRLYGASKSHMTRMMIGYLYEAVKLRLHL